jgi:hypothetical protein
MTRLVPVVLVLLTVAAPATAADNPVVQTYIEEIAADAWTISGFDSTLELTDAGLSGEFRIARIVLKQTNRTFDDVRIGCELIRLTTRTVGCTKAAFTADIPAVGRQTVGGSFTYDRYTHIANLRFLDAAIAGGRVRADVRVTETGFEVRYAGTQLQLDGLLVRRIPPAGLPMFQALSTVRRAARSTLLRPRRSAIRRSQTPRARLPRTVLAVRSISRPRWTPATRT